MNLKKKKKHLSQFCGLPPLLSKHKWSIWFYKVLNYKEVVWCFSELYCNEVRSIFIIFFLGSHESIINSLLQKIRNHCLKVSSSHVHESYIKHHNKSSETDSIEYILIKLLYNVAQNTQGLCELCAKDLGNEKTSPFKLRNITCVHRISLSFC